MKPFSGLNRAFRFCLTVSGALMMAQVSTALAADDMRDDGPGNGIQVAVSLHGKPVGSPRGSLLATPALPFPAEDGAAAQQRVSGLKRTITLPHALRSPGRVQASARRSPAHGDLVHQVLAPRILVPRSKPAPSSGQATGQLPPRGGTETGTSSAGRSFFGTKAIPFANIATAKDWNRVKHRRTADAKTDTCTTADCKERTVVLAGFSGSDETGSFFAKLEKANRVVNANIRYQEDLVTYKRLDYWATADEIVRIGAGDCEDFAILKYALLLEAGVPASSMSLVVLKDLKRNLFHAVLAVSTNKGHFILDNVVDRVYLDQEVRHYRPMFSFSTDRSWIHGTPTDAAPRLVSALAAIAPGTDRSPAEPPQTLSRGDWADVYPVKHD